MTRAVCAPCQYTLDKGEPLPEDTLTQYQLNKSDMVDVSMVVVREEQKLRATLPKFTLRSMGGNLLEAIGFKKRQRPVEPKQSLAVVARKQREGLFSNTTLGDMQEIDRKLQDEQEQR